MNNEELKEQIKFQTDIEIMRKYREHLQTYVNPYRTEPMHINDFKDKSDRVLWQGLISDDHRSFVELGFRDGKFYYRLLNEDHELWQFGMETAEENGMMTWLIPGRRLFARSADPEYLALLPKFGYGVVEKDYREDPAAEERKARTVHDDDGNATVTQPEVHVVASIMDYLRVRYRDEE